MLATSPNTVLAPAEEESAPTMVADAPTQSSLMDFENKLKETEQRKTSVPARNDLLARVQAAQQRSRLAQEKQKQEQQIKVQAEKEDENILVEKLEDTQIASKDPPPVPNDTANTLNDFFDSPAPVIHNSPPQTAPSAPPVIEETTNYSTLNPVPPPAAAVGQDGPPSFEQFEARLKSNEIDDEVFNLDADGNSLSPQQRQEMLLEQEKILKQIEEEKIANDRAIAELTAEEDYPSQRVQAPETSTGVAQGNVATAAPSGNVRTIEIAPNKRVALHGQDRTKEAIKKGTAVLIQCLNCQNWMQVTPTATLMYCPVCGVVSPVEHQSSVVTKNEAMQLSLDRLLAEKIQKEEYAAARGGQDEGETEEGFLSGFKASVFGSSSNAATGVPSEEHQGLTNNTSRNAAKKQSWAEFLASYVPGASVAEEDDANKPRSAEIVVGRKSHPKQRSAASIYGGDSEEEVSFTGGNEGEQASLLRPALVAESKPLFSCMVDSVSTMLTGQSAVPDGKLHGVDTSNLLSISDAGRKQDDGRGDYQNLNSY